MARFPIGYGQFAWAMAVALQEAEVAPLAPPTTEFRNFSGVPAGSSLLWRHALWCEGLTPNEL